MSPITQPASLSNQAPSPTTDQISDAGFAADFQEMYSRGMDRALGIQKVSLAAAFQLNSDAIDKYLSALWFSPGDLLDRTAKAFTSCMEFQMSLLTLMMSHVSDTVGSFSGMQAQITAVVLERNKDIAIGAQPTPPSATGTSSSRSQTHTKKEVRGASDDSAIEEGVA